MSQKELVQIREYNSTTIVGNQTKWMRINDATFILVSFPFYWRHNTYDINTNIYIYIMLCYKCCTVQCSVYIDVMIMKENQKQAKNQMGIYGAGKTSNT